MNTGKKARSSIRPKETVESLARKKKRQLLKLAMDERDLKQEAALAELTAEQTSAAELEKVVIGHLQQVLEKAYSKRPKKRINILELFPNLWITNRELELLTKVYGLDGRQPVPLNTLSKQWKAPKDQLQRLLAKAKRRILLAILKKPGIESHVKKATELLLEKEEALAQIALGIKRDRHKRRAEGLRKQRMRSGKENQDGRKH